MRTCRRALLAAASLAAVVAALHCGGLLAGTSNAVAKPDAPTNQPAHSEPAKPAARVMGSVGPEALPGLLETITNANTEPHRRTEATLSLWYLGTNAHSAIPILLDAIPTHPKGNVWAIFYIIAQLKPSPQVILPAYKRILESTNTTSQCRSWAIGYLNVSGYFDTYREQAKPLVPSLLRAVKARDWPFDIIAQEALQKTDPAVLSNVPPVPPINIPERRPR
jgi:hypothetical protein